MKPRISEVIRWMARNPGVVIQAIGSLAPIVPPESSSGDEQREALRLELERQGLIARGAVVRDTCVPEPRPEPSGTSKRFDRLEL